MAKVYPWTGQKTASGFNKIGPLHKLPHPAKPFKCTLYNLLKPEKGGDQRAILRLLKMAFQRMEGMGFKPFFEETEINNLFTAELITYAEGRYPTPQDLSNSHRWMDYLNNRGANAAKMNRTFLKKGKGTDPANERLDIVKDLQTGLRTLKLAEDWLYYHPKERNMLAQMIDKHLAS